MSDARVVLTKHRYPLLDIRARVQYYRNDGAAHRIWLIPPKLGGVIRHRRAEYRSEPEDWLRPPIIGGITRRYKAEFARQYREVYQMIQGGVTPMGPLI